MKLSVIIPVYNGAKTISELSDELVKSLKNYELELVLVNDGSTDETSEVLEDIASKTPNMRVYHKSRGGPGSAINHGVEKALSDFQGEKTNLFRWFLI